MVMTSRRRRYASPPPPAAVGPTDEDLRALYAGLALLGLLAGRLNGSDMLLHEASMTCRAAVQFADTLLRELRASNTPPEAEQPAHE